MIQVQKNLAQQLNLETGKISWSDLQRYFAAGRLLLLDDELDLVETAALFVKDDASAVEALLGDSKLKPATTEQARDSQKVDSLFWAVVVAPWVLAQEITQATD